LDDRSEEVRGSGKRHDDHDHDHDDDGGGGGGKRRQEAEGREGALLRSSEIVALPCLRASYCRYLFRRAAKQHAASVWTGQPVVIM